MSRKLLRSGYGPFVTGIVILALSGTYWVGAKKAASVQFLCGEPSVDLGAVSKGETIKHVFDFENCSKNWITVDDVYVQCTCTLAKAIKGTKVAPGSHLSIPVSMDTSNKTGMAKSLVILYYLVSGASGSSPRKFACSMEITAHIVSKIKFQPEYLDFGEVDINEPEGGINRSRGFAIEARDGRDFLALDVRSSDALFNVKRRQAFPPSSKIIFDVQPSYSVLSQMRGEKLGAYLEVFEKQKGRIIERVPVSIILKKRYKVEPEQFLIKYGDVQPRLLRISFDNRMAMIRSINCNDPDITCVNVGEKIWSKNIAIEIHANNKNRELFKRIDLDITVDSKEPGEAGLKRVTVVTVPIFRFTASKSGG